MARKRSVLNLLAKAYTFDMLESLREKPKRFKDLKAACENEKMRSQRLRELEDSELIKVKVRRIGRRPISIYELSELGKGTLKLAEEIKKLYEKKRSE